MRSHRDHVRPIPIGPALSSAVPEIRTLGEAAVSRIGRQTASGPAHPRPWLLIMAVAAAGLATVYFVAGIANKLPAPQAVRATVAAPAPVPPPPAPSPVVPAAIEIGLDSAPAGARVYVGDVLIGTTPARYQTAPGGEPVEFTFRLDGFEPEQIRALPAKGLTVTAKFISPLAPKRPASTKRKHGRAAQASPSDDIQTER
jgi:hypothetical protein